MLLFPEYFQKDFRSHQIPRVTTDRTASTAAATETAVFLLAMTNAPCVAAEETDRACPMRTILERPSSNSGGGAKPVRGRAAKPPSIGLSRRSPRRLRACCSFRSTLRSEHSNATAISVVERPPKYRSEIATRRSSGSSSTTRRSVSTSSPARPSSISRSRATWLSRARLRSALRLRSFDSDEMRETR